MIICLRGFTAFPFQTNRRYIYIFLFTRNSFQNTLRGLWSNVSLWDDSSFLLPKSFIFMYRLDLHLAFHPVLVCDTRWYLKSAPFLFRLWWVLVNNCYTCKNKINSSLFGQYLKQLPVHCADLLLRPEGSSNAFFSKQYLNNDEPERLYTILDQLQP